MSTTTDEVSLAFWMEIRIYPTCWAGSLRRTIWESGFTILILAGGFPSLRETILEVPLAGSFAIETLTVVRGLGMRYIV